MRRRTLWLATLAVIVLSATAAAAAFAQNDGPGFKTDRDPMLVPAIAPQPGAPAGVGTEALITVGETLPGGYRFEAIPDGISLWPRGNGRLDLFVNHETSTVPFPYLPAATAAAHSQNDFDNSQVSVLSLHHQSMGVLQGKMAITSDENFQRFCSNFLATKEHGFDRPTFFTNEEGIDWVNRSGRAWPPPAPTTSPYEATSPSAREIGVAVAYDVQNGKHETIYGMGRHNHENTVAVPGYGKPVLLSGDDTFVSLPPQSQLYMYSAEDGDAVMNDEGDLYAFRADPPAVNDYFDFVYGTRQSISGEFVKVPDFEDDPTKSIAHGQRANGTDVVADDFDYPLPPTSGWQLSPFAPTHGIDGPQWVLEHWGDLNNVFQFIRVEDIAYDKRPGMQNIVYIVDSGAGSNGAPAAGLSTNGRIWRMVLDPNDHTQVLSLSVLVDGDEDPVSRNTAALVPPSPGSAERAYGEIRQPDNLDTTANGSMLVTEDPGSRQQFPADSTDPFRTTARLWQVTLPPAGYDPLTAPYDGLSKRVVAVVDQGYDEEVDYDQDPPDAGVPPAPAFLISPGNLGAWESSGVIDTSSVFGPGTFLVTVQAHTLAVEWEAGDLNTVTSNDPLPDFQYKREGGQLLLIRVPGA
jgi:hypothetical protein